MKKSRILLGVSAMILAVVSAFITQNISPVTFPWHHTQPNEAGVCAQYTNLCSGGTHQTWTQSPWCTQGNMAFTGSNCIVHLFTNPYIR